MGGQTPQAVVIGRNGAVSKAAKIALPHIEQRQLHGQVMRQICRAEMFVHGVRARQHGFKTRLAYADGDG